MGTQHRSCGISIPRMSKVALEGWELEGHFYQSWTAKKTLQKSAWKGNLQEEKNQKGANLKKSPHHWLLETHCYHTKNVIVKPPKLL